MVCFYIRAENLSVISSMNYVARNIENVFPFHENTLRMDRLERIFISKQLQQMKLHVPNEVF